MVIFQLSRHFVEGFATTPLHQHLNHISRKYSEKGQVSSRFMPLVMPCRYQMIISQYVQYEKRFINYNNVVNGFLYGLRRFI